MQLAELENHLRKLDDQVHRIDQQIVDMETQYLENSKAAIVRGLDFYLTNRPIGTGARARQQRLRLKDRVFSLSSAQNSALVESANFNIRHHTLDDDDDD
jgi:uncharacterized protein YdcH (DUF465 family)